MARIVLIDGGAGVTTAVEAVAAGHELVACTLAAAPEAADLAVIDYTATAPVDRSMCGGLDRRMPVLLLVDRRVRIEKSLHDAPGIALLRKPFDLFELRAKMRALLAGGTEPSSEALAAPAAPSPAGARKPEAATTPDWLAPPLIMPSAAATLAAARQMTSSLWIVGEMGSGREQVAAALVRRRQPPLDLVTWYPGQPFEDAATACRPTGTALLVPDIEARPLSEQQRLESYLARHPDRFVVATSADDPADAVVAGAMSRRLYHLLSRLSVRLPALRERRAEIGTLAAAMTAWVGARAFPGSRVRLSPAAIERLEAYAWPGNVTELEAVITRSVIAREPANTDGVCTLDAADLVFAPSLSPADMPVAAAPVRSGVVVPLPSARRLEEAAATVAPAETSGIEPVLAGLAHELRNPMATLKTYATLAAADAGDGEDGELARLAAEACARIDGHLDLMQRYSDLPDASPSAVDMTAAVADAIAALGYGDNIKLTTKRSAWVRIDPHHARFIAEALAEECMSRLAGGDEAWIDAGAGRGSLVLHVPAADLAVDKLGKWVRGQALPWRLTLAREVARRGGGDVEVSADGEELRVMWQAVAAEDARDGEQAGSTDRRRRSRGS